ncbi:MAG: hypothetical protein ACKVZH_19320 [Blastocatellia bacterium]
MATATKSATADEILTMYEIKNRFNSEWVLIADPETDQFHNVLSGRVIFHHKDRAVFDVETLKIKPFPKESAFLYLGERPKNLITRFFIGFQLGE